MNEYNKISLEQLDLIITSDHTVFKDELLNDFKDVNRKLGWAIPEDMSYCPLIINSPKIKENRSYNISAYQMDIYPTIQSLIGDTTYVWKGLGENLLDSTCIDNRKTDESNLYQLSNRIIRNNTLSRYIE